MTDQPMATEQAPETPTPKSSLASVGKHTLIYAFGTVLNRIVAFVMLPLYTHQLTAADYGVLQLLGMTTDVISIVAGSRIAEGIYYLFHKEEDAASGREVLSTALICLSLSYAVCALIAGLLSVQISSLLFRTPDHALLVRVAATAFGFEGLLLVALNYLQLQNRSQFYVIVSAVKLFIQLTVNIVCLLVLHWGPVSILLGTLTANVVIGIWVSTLMVREVGIHFKKSAARALLAFGLPLVGTQVATFASTYGDRFFLQASGGPAVVGLYALSYQFGFVLVYFGFGPFFNVWQPTRFAIAKQADRDETYAKGFIFCNLILITSAVGIGLFVQDFLNVMTAPEYRAAGAIVPVILLAYLLQGWSDFQNLGILVKERTHLITVANWVCAGVSLIGYTVLIPRYLAWGAAFATLLAFLSRYLIIFYYSQRLWPVHLRWGPVLGQLGWAGALTALGYVLPHPGIIASVAIRVGLFGLYLAGMWYLRILSDSDRQLIAGIIRQPRSAFTLLRG
ncbi:MAG: oligosaccharide flippase family protein [Gemmatimonadales bacterium]